MLLTMLARTAAAASPIDEPRAPAAVPPSRVVLVTDETDDAVVREAATRLDAELGAAGFEVVRIARPPGADLRAVMERTARATRAFAAAAISRSAAGTTADLWIVDRVTRKTVVRAVEVDGPAAPSVLAVRAVELLQASLLEATTPLPRAAPNNARAPSLSTPEATPEDVARWMAPAGARRGMLDGFSLEAGAVVLQSTGGVGPALGPALRFSFGAPSGEAAARSPFPQGLAARLTLAGPALGPALRGASGSVSVRQELAALELVHALELGSRLVPVLSAGAGAHHLRAEGAPRAPYASAGGDVWSFMASAGVGAAFRITERAALLLDVHALFLQPRPVVALAGERLGSAGRPTLAGFFGLVVRP